jgi:ribosomal protein S12 methylthiotransferase accessory factor
MCVKRRDRRLLLRGQGVLFDALDHGLRSRTPALDARRGLPDDGSGGAVVVTAHDVPDIARDRTVQDRLGQLGAPWLPVWADHSEVWLGPWILPGGGACIACVAARAFVPELIGRRVPGRPPAGPRFLPAWLGRLLAAIVARELARLRDRAAAPLQGRALVWSLVTLHAELHPVSRLAGCPACPPGADDSPGQARETFARLFEPCPGDGPQEGSGPSLDRLTADLVSPRAGLVRGVRLQDGPLPMALAESVVAHAAGRQVLLSAGRSTSPDEARRVALLEALERQGGLAPGGRRPVLRASYRDLAERALDPRALVLHSPEQYRAPAFPYRPFDERRELTWVWGYSFRDGRATAVPASAVYYGSGSERRVGDRPERLAYETSNGCAVGRTTAEAVGRALLEVMERDGFLMAWYTRRTRAPLDLGSARDWRLVLLTRRLERLGYSAMAWDVTQDLGAPVVWVAAVSDSPDRPRTFSSCGCHPDPEAATWSALVEVAAGLRQLSRRYESERERERAAAMWSDPDSVRTMDDHGLLYAAPQAERHLAFLLGDRRDRVRFQDWFGARHEGSGRRWAERSRLLVDAVIGAGLDAIAVDQTTPEQAAMGLVGVRVLVPGALPMTFGHGARRLEGADRLARRLRSAGARGVNPWPHPFP